MGNIFDPKRLIHNIQQQQPGKHNTAVTVPNNRLECAMLINGYLSRRRNEFINETINYNIPMDLIDIIGIFYPYSNMIERKAVKICVSHNKNINSFTKTINKSVKYLINEHKKLGYIANITDPNKIIVNFFYYQRHSLNKHAIGDYFKANQDMIMFKEYLDLFNFKNMSIDMALRDFLCVCSMPGRAQLIDKIIQLLADKYYNDYMYTNNACAYGMAYDDLCVDDIYILTYSIIMLNPSLHNPLVKNPMTKEQFIRNSNFALQSNAAKQMLNGIYDRIKAREIT